MMQLAGILYSLMSTTLAGSAILVMLVAGFDRLTPIVVAAAGGFVLAAPAAWALAHWLTRD